MGGLTQLSIESGMAMNPDLYDINGRYALSWDFSGMNSDEILTALLDGGETIFPVIHT